MRQQKRVFRIYDGSLQERFQHSRAKIQIFGGGFANGKTANAVIKALELAKDFPGSNGLIARSTYPKLNDTIRKEFIKWCPPHWIERFPKSANSENTAYLKNGTAVNFRYVQQQGKSNESSTTNLLSATYDWIIVDQIDDPEFSFKDLLDLAGRLRGSTTYEGKDATWPSSGPRIMIVTCNPTRNWFFKKIIRPLQNFEKTGRLSKELGQLLAAFDQTTPAGLMELFEGSTYENKENLPADYIKMLEGLYTGQMRERFLLGLWGAYEGLVYPQYDETQHMLTYSWMREYFAEVQSKTNQMQYLEAYDHGIAKPACYLFGFVDLHGNVLLLDGFYEAEMSIEKAAAEIKRIRRKYIGFEEAPDAIFADPSIFRRGTGTTKVVGVKVSTLFKDEGIIMRRGNNDIVNGIAKVQSYLNPQRFHRNPLTGNYPAPYLYVSDKLDFWHDEIVDYYWKKNAQGDVEDVPQDKNDHAMDSTKYLLSLRPKLSTILMPTKAQRTTKALSTWHEREPSRDVKAQRYGRQRAA